MTESTWVPTPEQQLKYLTIQRDMCYGNMEGEDGPGFARWEKLFCAYAVIVEDMQKELRGDFNGK